jgi:hypothetical protein
MSSWNFIDRTGQTFGRLTVIGLAPKSASGHTRWHCCCECGEECTVLSTGLVSGNSASCGCLQREATASSNATRIKHGHTRGHKTSPEWRSWKSMLDRCSLPSMPNYPLYGGRGITVCEQWRGKDGFSQFYSDLGKRPKGCSLDRIDSDGNYEPGNVRWATAKEQSNNRRALTADAKERQIKVLNDGRKRMWSDPEIRERLLESRRKR